MPRQPRKRENSHQIDRRIETPAFVQPLAPSLREIAEPRMNVQEIGGEVIRLKPPAPAPRLPARQTIAPLPLAGGPDYRPRGESRRLRALRLRWLAASLLAALLITGVIFIKSRQKQQAATAGAPAQLNDEPCDETTEALPAAGEVDFVATEPAAPTHPRPSLVSKP